MAWLEKREEIFCKRDRAGWTALKSALRDAGIRGVRAWHYEEAPPVGGCGCKLDIRNFGPNGRIDREVYVITVPVSALEQATEIVQKADSGEN